MDKAFAERFAAGWIGSWNAHDLGRVLSHYANDFEMSSRFFTLTQNRKSRERSRTMTFGLCPSHAFNATLYDSD